jgi:hypothetical protein
MRCIPREAGPTHLAAGVAAHEMLRSCIFPRLCKRPLVKCSFFQYVPHAPHWDWGIVWGHASSDDLVTWTLEPNALHPTQGGADSSGCWSGCVSPSASGNPCALYTGVRLKGATYSGHKTREYAPNEPMVESVMLARCKEDPCLQEWEQGGVVIEEPPDLGAASVCHSVDWGLRKCTA